MTRRVNFLVVISLAIIFICSSAALSHGEPAEPTKKIEIIIKNGAFKVISGSVVTGVPIEIIVHNEDTIMHGFNSSLFEPNTKVEMSGGSLAPGKEARVYRVVAGKTMVLKFTASPERDVSMYSFWCDLHLHEKVEMMIIEDRF